MDVLCFSDGSTRKKKTKTKTQRWLHGVNVQANNACENCLRETRNYGDVYVECRVYNKLCLFCLPPIHIFMVVRLK